MHASVIILVIISTCKLLVSDFNNHIVVNKQLQQIIL